MPLKTDYTPILEDVIAEYKNCGNAHKVAHKFHISTATVARLLSESGISMSRKSRAIPKALPKTMPKGSCYFCRSFSRTSQLEGYCMKHHRPTRATDIEYCYS